MYWHFNIVLYIYIQYHTIDGSRFWSEFVIIIKNIVTQEHVVF